MKVTRIICDICGENITRDYIELKAIEHTTTLWYASIRSNRRIAICDKCKKSLVTMVKNQREWEGKNGD